jgi:hypothetical protein
LRRGVQPAVPRDREPDDERQHALLFDIRRQVGGIVEEGGQLDAELPCAMLG